MFMVFVAFGFPLVAQEVKSNTTTETDKKPIELTVDANRVFVRNATLGDTLTVFSVVGLKMNEIAIKSATVEYMLNVPKGYYILKIGETVRKVVIK
jgi:hypothetical protein